MARQRFIWPDLWADPDFGKLSPLDQVLYIGCFSNADDEGRLLGDPTYLRTTIIPYQRVSDAKVRAARERVCAAMSKLVLYEVAGTEYLAFTNWHEWQKPKYPKPSRLPARTAKSPKMQGNSPGQEKRSRNVSGKLPEDSRKASGSLPKASSVGWVGLGWDSSSPTVTVTEGPARATPSGDGGGDGLELLGSAFGVELARQERLQ